MSKRTYEQIQKERDAGLGQMVWVPAVRTVSGVRFGYAKKVDFEEYYWITKRRENARKEEMDRAAEQRERMEIERKRHNAEAINRFRKLKEERKQNESSKETGSC